MPLTFFGGIRPEGRKFSRSSPLRIITPPDIVFIPVSAETVTAVSAGDKIFVGTPVAYDKENPVCSPVSGVVKGKAKEDDQDYIALQNDGNYTPDSGIKGADKAITDYTSVEICALSKKFGIVDSDGIPLYKKLTEDMPQATRIIINCCEHDSYSTVLYRLFEENPKELIGGAKILMHALSVKKSVIVLESRKKESYDRLLKYINDSDMFIAANLEMKYPITEKTILSAIYAKEIPHGRTSRDIGYAFFGLEAVVQLYNSFVTGLPQLYKAITVSGESASNPSNLLCPIGTPIKRVVEECEGLSHRCRCVVSGGLMDGEFMGKPGGVVTAYTKQLLLLREYDEVGNGNCIRCTRCIQVCPMHLSPMDYALQFEKGKSTREKNTFYGIAACIECGCCEYICPNGVSLLDIIRNVKIRKADALGDTLPEEEKPSVFAKQTKKDDDEFFTPF